MECRSDEAGRGWIVEVMRQAASCVAMKLIKGVSYCEVLYSNGMYSANQRSLAALIGNLLGLSVHSVGLVIWPHWEVCGNSTHAFTYQRPEWSWGGGGGGGGGGYVGKNVNIQP